MLGNIFFRFSFLEALLEGRENRGGERRRNTTEHEENNRIDWY